MPSNSSTDSYNLTSTDTPYYNINDTEPMYNVFTNNVVNWSTQYSSFRTINNEEDSSIPDGTFVIIDDVIPELHLRDSTNSNINGSNSNVNVNTNPVTLNTTTTSILSFNSDIKRNLYEIREKLTSLGVSYLTIAGGAPRDLYLNHILAMERKAVKDFDIYLINPTDLPIEKSELASKGFTNVELLGIEDYQNDDEPISQVIYAKYNGIEVNLVIYRQNTTKQEIINNFSCSLSKFELDLDNNNITAYKEALLSIDSKTLIFKPQTKDSYKNKIIRYFPTYTVGSYQDAVLTILDKSLNKYSTEIPTG